MSINIIDGKKVVLSRASSSVEIYFHGATLTSWKLDGKEQLFLSKKALLDGSKAIRGGVPLVFPQFGLGPAMPKLQHGFARISAWTLNEQRSVIQPDFVSVEFELTSSPKTKELWPYDFHLVYYVKLSSDSLFLNLKIINTDKLPFEFTTLLHSYFTVEDISNVSVYGLRGMNYVDQLTNLSDKQENDIQFTEEFDRTYFNVGSSPEYVIDDHRTRRKICIQTSFKDVVVWNPWIEKGKSMADLHPDGYKEFVCVEVGNVHDSVHLAPGESFEGSQLLTIK